MVEEITSRLAALLRKIPKGKVTTYGTLAEKLRTSPRHVGYLLKHNPRPVVIPCHRVVKANGEIGGYAYGGKMNVRKKIKLLESEGVHVKKDRVTDFEQKVFKF